MRADDIGLNKGIRPFDRSVHVGFGRKMDNRIEAFFPQQAFNQRRIADITMNKPKFRTRADRLKIRQIASIGQGIQDHDACLRMRIQPVSNEVRPNEAGTAGNEKSRHLYPFRSLVRLSARDELPL